MRTCVSAAPTLLRMHSGAMWRMGSLALRFILNLCLSTAITLASPKSPILIWQRFQTNRHKCRDADLILRANEHVPGSQVTVHNLLLCGVRMPEGMAAGRHVPR